MDLWSDLKTVISEMDDNSLNGTVGQIENIIQPMLDPKARSSASVSPQQVAANLEMLIQIILEEKEPDLDENKKLEKAKEISRILMQKLEKHI